MAYCHFCKFIWRYYHLAVRIPSEQVGKSRQLSQAETCHPGQPVALNQWYMPQLLKLLFNSLKMYDPDFGRAFVDERMYSDFDHSAALCRPCVALCWSYIPTGNGCQVTVWLVLWMMTTKNGSNNYCLRLGAGECVLIM